MSKLFIYIMIIAVITVASVSATTINVPADYAAIQAGIDASSNGDTVLVQPGIYAERINFYGKAIVVKSTDGANMTIIERAVGLSSIVTFDNGEDNNSVLDGFTVRNTKYSHGISCISSSPIIINCIIENTDSFYNGGGIYFGDNSAPIIRKNVIRNNYAWYGAGICCGNCDQDHIALIDSNVFYNNQASGNGSAFHAMNCVCIFRYNLVYSNQAHWGTLRIDASGSIIENNTFINNTSLDRSGCILAEGDYSTDTYIRNNIFFNNSYYGVYINDGSNYHLSYNCFYANGSGPYYNINPEAGNIYEYPLFTDTSVNNYHLTSLSPCIDAGDSLSPYDPDSTVADIGALYYSGYYNTGYISGLIINSLDEALEGVQVEELDYGIIDTSSIDGSFLLENLDAPISYDLLFSLPGYSDTVINDVFILQNDTAKISLTYRIPCIFNGVAANFALEPIEGICVELENHPEINDTTNINGEYMLDYIPGVYTLLFYHPAYCDTEITDITINYGDTLDVDVVMGVGNSVITGNVIDSLSLDFLGNVSVTTSDVVSMTAMTDSAGNYTLNICEGVHDIIFSKSCYDDIIISDVEIEPNDTITIDVNMFHVGDRLLAWVGGTFDEYDNWHDTIYAANNTWIDIPVYLMGSSPEVYIGSLCLPLGINLTYINAFYWWHCQLYYPFSCWDDPSFCHENCDPPLPEGWRSLSFLGFYDCGGGRNPPGHWETPTLGFTFRVHITDVEDYRDTTIFDAIDLGNDPYYPPFAGDTLGADGYPFIVNWACLHIMPKQQYLPGDANMFLGIWPPQIMGSDVTYMVNYFVGMLTSQPCLLDGFWASADVNGDCIVMGSDVVKLGRYFKGEDSISFCPDYYPYWLTIDDIPDDQPLGWPPCE